MLDAISLFSGGKITDNAGAFVQWTYNNLTTTDNLTFTGHGALDNTDVRVVKKFGAEDKPTVIGLTLHNNPTVQDIYNTAPAWSFPYWAPSVAAPGRGTPTFLETGARVAGIGAYAYLFDSLYLEATSYQTAKGFLSPLRAGTPDDQRVTLTGANPYWRIAYTIGDDHQSLTIGHFGAIADVKDPTVDTRQTNSATSDSTRNSSISARTITTSSAPRRPTSTNERSGERAFPTEAMTTPRPSCALSGQRQPTCTTTPTA